MPRYYFRVSHGPYSGSPDAAFDCAHEEDAWKEMTRVCGELLSGVVRTMSPNSNWQMELMDETSKPLFRIRLVTETLA